LTSWHLPVGSRNVNCINFFQQPAVDNTSLAISAKHILSRLKRLR